MERVIIPADAKKKHLIAVFFHDKRRLVDRFKLIV